MQMMIFQLLKGVFSGSEQLYSQHYHRQPEQRTAAQQQGPDRRECWDQGHGSLRDQGREPPLSINREETMGGAERHFPANLCRKRLL